jgi:hypothetical protein
MIISVSLFNVQDIIGQESSNNVGFLPSMPSWIPFFCHTLS